MCATSGNGDTGFVQVIVASVSVIADAAMLAGGGTSASPVTAGNVTASTCSEYAEHAWELHADDCIHGRHEAACRCQAKVTASRTYLDMVMRLRLQVRHHQLEGSVSYASGLCR